MLRSACWSLTLVLLASCSSEDHAPRYQGYVEGEPVRVAPSLGGRLDRLLVARGDMVAAGAPLFALDAQSELAALQEAQARLSSAQSKLADLQKGRRPDELDVLRAQLAQAKIQRELSAAQLKRQQALLDDGSISRDLFDQISSQHRRDSARVDELNAQLRSGELAGREDALKSADDEVRASVAVVAGNQWQLDQKTLTAPAAGSVEDVYYRSGEWVAPGAPVLELLPPQNRKLRFFVPETALAGLKVGQQVSARCDGCEAAIIATIRHIASSAEYTPPVLYSREQRGRLVFLVEAQPDPADALRLHPGQPVDVELTP